jgi:F0F1-type ATP synthase beta subunit
MRIIEVTSEQFHQVWNRMIPANRIQGQLPTPAIVLYHLDALLVLKGKVQYGVFPDIDPEEIRIADLPKYIDSIFQNEPQKAA